MASLGLTAWVVRTLQLMPSPLHRALDAWSQRQALRQLQRRRHRSIPPK